MINQNIEYSFYHNVYNNGLKGLIPAESFGLCVTKAWREVNAMLTSEYTEEHSDLVKKCVCEVAEEIYENAKKQGIKSENIDGYSVTYADGINPKKLIKNIIISRLGDTGLLYGGVDR